MLNSKFDQLITMFSTMNMRIYIDASYEIKKFLDIISDELLSKSLEKLKNVKNIVK